MCVKEGDDDSGKGNGDGNGNKEGDGNQPQQHKKRVARERRRRQWQWGGQRHEGHGRSHNAWREGDDGGNGPWFVWQRKSDGGNNGNGEGDGTKDMAAHTMPGETGMMVAMGHGLCVSFWVSEKMTKIRKRAKT